MADPSNRDTAGRFGPGNNANPKGRSRELPDWFLEAGPEALKHLLSVARGEQEDELISRAKACDGIADRIYGKPKQAVEVAATRGILSDLLGLVAPTDAPSDE